MCTRFASFITSKYVAHFMHTNMTFSLFSPVSHPDMALEGNYKKILPWVYEYYNGVVSCWFSLLLIQIQYCKWHIAHTTTRPPISIYYDCFFIYEYQNINMMCKEIQHYVHYTIRYMLCGFFPWKEQRQKRNIVHACMHGNEWILSLVLCTTLA